MSEIKVNKMELVLQLDALNSAGESINIDVSSITSDGVETLNTSLKYIEQHKQIADLMDLYKQLIAKDAKDIKAMQNAVSQLDVIMSQSFTGSLQSPFPLIKNK